MRLNTIYRGIARCTLGDGSTFSFWDDLWSDSLLSVEYPRLYSFAKNNSISVQSLMLEQDLDAVFFLPLSTQACDELLLLQNCLRGITYDDTTADSWPPVWGAKYSSRRFYAHAFSGVEAHQCFKMVWKSSCIPRIKFFVFVDRLNTKTMLCRRHQHFVFSATLAWKKILIIYSSNVLSLCNAGTTSTSPGTSVCHCQKS
jgi:hypothetical protein